MKKVNFYLLTIIGVLLVGMITPFATVSANESSDGGVTIIKQGENSLQYVHKKKEGTFKVVEKISPDTGNVESKIYLLNSNDEYELYETQKVTITENKDAIVETKPVNDEKREVVLKNKQITHDLNSTSKESTIFADELTPWTYSGTTEYYTQSLAGMTIYAVKTILDNTIGLPGWGNILADAAISIVNNSYDSVYISKITSYKNPVGTTILAGTQEITRIYETSAKSNLIPGGYGVNEECAPGYDCSQ